MLILFAKSQLGLFDKIVPVAGSVSKDGTVRAPHTAIRHVRAPQPKAPPHHAANLDLFAAPAAEKPKPAPKPKPESTTLDLFENGPKFDTSAERVRESPKTEHVAPVAAEVPDREDSDPEPEKSTQIFPIGKTDYSKPFDPDKIPAFGVLAGTSKERRREINAKAANLAEHRSMCPPDELVLLRQYSGNGGCGDSLNEFYTDPKVAAAMWKVLHDMGAAPAGATALEPSCATGVFLEMAPQGVKVTGVEMDPVSAKIGKLLHFGQEVQNASLERFAREDGRQFDVVIGNAPFGLRGSLIKDDKKDLSTAEGYFLDTALDKTKGGGVVAMIVPTGVLDSKRDRKLRERLLRKGEFLGALRMPNTAFEHSHTGVTTDVVFFRKRPQDVAGALGAVDQATLKKLGVWDDDYLAGAYFAERGAANVLGTMTEGWRAKAGMGDDITVEGSMVGVPEAIAEFQPEKPDTAEPTVEAILAACLDETMRERALAGAASNPYEKGKRGDTKTVDGVAYVLEGEPLRWHRVDEFMQDKAVTDAQELAAEIERAMTDDGYAEASGLADKVNAYVEAHGIPAKNTNLQLAASADKSLYRLIGAVKPDGSLSDVVSGRRAAVMESSFDAAAQSLALENGDFTPEQVAGRWHGGDTEAVLDHLYASPDYALDPASGRWTSTDQYLSGEMWPKLDAAQASLADESAKPEDRAKFERQAKLLEETIDPKSLEDVEVSLNSAFLPIDVVAAFFNRDDKAFDGRYAPQRMTITFDKGVYAVSGGPWGSALLDKYLNRTGVKKDDLPEIERWNREFKEWLCASSYRDQIEEQYNRKFRGFRQRGYSDRAFEIPGLNTEGLKPHIYSGIRQAIEQGKGIVADDVGLGKTVAGLILARMAKVTGQAKRPMIIVPKSVLANWVAEADRWFPGCSVLTIGETYTRDKDGNLKGKQDSAAERNRKYHDLTQNDYDFVLISQPAWNDLDLDPITKGKYVEDDFWVQRGDSLGNAGDKRTNKIREAYDQAMAKREFERRTDAIYFNDLGVDMLIGDEMHKYKNLFAAKNRFGQSPKFLGGSGLSNRALDMQLKTRWLREHNGDKNVYGLTATPTKNSPLEIYSMLSHIAPEAFERIGIRNSEEFLDRFCEFRNENILNTRGEIEEALVTVGFKNLDELREIMRRYINRRTAEDVGLKLPTRDDRQHLVDMSAQQNEVYAELRVLAEQAKGKDATGDAHIFSIMDKMAKAAMDLELYDPETYAGAYSPKYAEAAQHIVAGAADGGQVVFADNLRVHDKMVEALVAGGIPRDQIAIINAQEAESSAKRQNIADAFNAGKLKVVIGNTATMGEGINLQKGTTDVHHLDLPWEPASMQQRNGRGLRQGNMSASVRLHTYLAKGSFDGYRYQTMMAKKDWQDLLWNGGNRVENLAREGALSRDDLMVMLAADPDKAREDLVKNKAAAEERFKAQKNVEAADDFDRFREMKRSLGAMKAKDREKPAAQRLRVKLDRLRLALEENPHFTAKHVLDSDKPVLVQPSTGHAYEEGTAFEIPTEGGAIHGGGKFVVMRVFPDVSLVKVRRYGAANGTPMSIELDKLDHAAPFEYDSKAEQASIAEHLTASAKDKLDNLRGLKDLHGLPSAVVEGAYDTIQRHAKEGAKEYKFDLGHGDVGLVKDGKAVHVASYDVRNHLDTHDVMLPTDEHRKLATAAYLENERGKRITREAVTGRRGGHTGEYKTEVKYPGGNAYFGTGSNAWGSIGDQVFGAGFSKGAHEAYQRAQVEQARRQTTTTAAISDIAHAAVKPYGSMDWPKRGLAVLWAKAKRDGVLSRPWSEIAPKDVPADVFSIGNGHDKRTMPHNATVAAALEFLAKGNNMHDLASAMAVSSGDHEGAVRSVLGMHIGPHTEPALRHLITKKPELAERRAGDFADIGPGRRAYDVYGHGSTPAHPLHARFGDGARDMTLADLTDRLGNDTGDRDAA